MKKIGILFSLIIVMAVIPLTYIVGRSRHGGGHHRSGHHSHSYRGGRSRNNAAWAIPLAIGTAAAIGSAAASSSDTRHDDTTYYPESYDDDYEYQNEDYLTPQP